MEKQTKTPETNTNTSNITQALGQVKKPGGFMMFMLLLLVLVIIVVVIPMLVIASPIIGLCYIFKAYFDFRQERFRLKCSLELKKEKIIKFN